MLKTFSKVLDRISEYLAARKGLLPIAGMGLIALNYALQLFGGGWLMETNLLLHLGALAAILGFLVAWAL